MRTESPSRKVVVTAQRELREVVKTEKPSTRGRVQSASSVSGPKFRRTARGEGIERVLDQTINAPQTRLAVDRLAHSDAVGQYLLTLDEVKTKEPLAAAKFECWRFQAVEANVSLFVSDEVPKLIARDLEPFQELRGIEASAIEEFGQYEDAVNYTVRLLRIPEIRSVNLWFHRVDSSGSTSKDFIRPLSISVLGFASDKTLPQDQFFALLVRSLKKIRAGGQTKQSHS